MKERQKNIYNYDATEIIEEENSGAVNFARSATIKLSTFQRFHDKMIQMISQYYEKMMM